MRRRWFLIGVAALLAVLCGVAVFAIWPREPNYQGKTLSLWLAELHAAINAGHYEPEYPARQAIRQIGTNALPTLIRILRARDSMPKQLLIKWVAKQNLLQVRIRSADERRYDAVVGYEALGGMAAEQVPALTETLESGPSLSIRKCAASALGQIGPSARLAAPALVRATKDKDDTVRNNSLWALSRIQPDPQLTIPALIDALNDPYRVARENAAIALGRYGPVAKAAIPALTGALTTNNAAGFALKLIAPDAAAQAGAK